MWINSKTRAILEEVRNRDVTTYDSSMVHFSPVARISTSIPYGWVNGDKVCAALAVFVVAARATNNTRAASFPVFTLFVSLWLGTREEPDLLAAFLPCPRRGAHQCEFYYWLMLEASTVIVY